MMVDSKTRQSRPRRKWFGLLFVILLIAGGCWLGHYCWLRLTLEPQPRDQYWAEKIDALDPPPADAIPWIDIEALFQNTPWLDSTLEPLPGFPNDNTSPLEGSWDRSRPTIEAMCQFFESAEFNAFRDRIIIYAEKGWKKPYDGDDVIQHIPMQWGVMLTVHSRWAIENQDWETAKQDWVTTLQIGRQIRRQHLLCSYTIESYLQLLVAREIIDASRTNKPVPRIRQLADQIEPVLGDPILSTSDIQGEYYSLRNYLDQRYVRHGKGWLDIPSTLDQDRMPWGRRGRTSVSRAWNILSFVFHSYEEACEKLDAMFAIPLDWTSLAELNANPQWVSTEELNVLDGEYDRYSYTQPTSFMKTLQSQINLRSVRHMELQAAITMLAIREFQQKNNRLPDTLEELVPDYCPLPHDYGNDQPLRYRKTEDGYILYSVALDGIDNQGKCDRSRKYIQVLSPDINFTTWQRNEPDDDSLIENPS